MAYLKFLRAYVHCVDLLLQHLHFFHRIEACLKTVEFLILLFLCFWSDHCHKSMRSVSTQPVLQKVSSTSTIYYHRKCDFTESRTCIKYPTRAIYPDLYSLGLHRQFYTLPDMTGIGDRDTIPYSYY